VLYFSIKQKKRKQQRTGRKEMYCASMYVIHRKVFGGHLKSARIMLKGCVIFTGAVDDLLRKNKLFLNGCCKVQYFLNFFLCVNAIKPSVIAVQFLRFIPLLQCLHYLCHCHMMFIFLLNCFRKLQFSRMQVS